MKFFLGGEGDDYFSKIVFETLKQQTSSNEQYPKTPL
jgi:hypothetical protein